MFKRLPGVERSMPMAEVEKVKKVSQLLVDGKKFFEGDTKLGSKNSS
jgi:hypothetical protein